MNTEQIINELVLLIDEMPIELHLHSKKTSKFLSFLKSVLTIITTDEQKIKELQAHNENLKKENKYLSERRDEETEHAKDLAITDTVKKMRHELITRVGSYKDKGDTACFGLFYRIITETTEELLKTPEEQ